MRAINWLTIALVTLLGHRTTGLEFEECSSAPQMGIYVASSSNCSKYIYCAGPGSFEAECLAGHYYDEKLERCLDRKLVKRCQDPSVTTTASPSVVKKPPIPIAAQKTEPLTITLRLLPNAGPCYPYMVCYEGAGLAKACTPAHLVSCNRVQSTENISSCQTGVYGFMAHPRYCAYFYYCSSGSKLIHRCPSNFTWHYERRSCVQQSEKKCYSDGLKLTKKKAVTRRPTSKISNVRI
ncbi:uncharacterized protein LOC108115724 [Drosophila eugracilis]|uniref:uncharacterized protein LOC108115724 n=1 Tax=Drosophila eugracilis TaxID=29029 RepID=UPI001BDADDD0|nr:uncharacterized protein LOC108115724 [Drosophila eugracilis]